MKLGKKALSCLLAIMMIVTSVSVCFTVLGADASTQARQMLNTITNVYDDLKNGWDLAHAAEPDTSRVPAIDAGTVWKVDELKKTLLLGEDTIEFSELAALQIVESDEE